MSDAQKIKAAIDAFNQNPPVEYYGGLPVPNRARLPILATDCDYEIVSISGVQGRRI
jgi:hypothetical protein